MGLHAQIGDVSTRTGLSVRTIRYYEEVGLVSPSARTSGGFRLYTDADVARLQLIKRMKPLGFALEEMRDLLVTLDSLEAGDGSPNDEESVTRLEMYRDLAVEHCIRLREQLDEAEGFAADLRKELRRHDVKAGRQ